MLQVRDGEFTSTIYGLIRDERFGEAVEVLTVQLGMSPGSRAGLSLLGYCHFQSQDFLGAAECYEQLRELCPDSEEYRLYAAQALYHASLFPQAMAAAAQVTSPDSALKVLKLQAAIKYGEDDLQNAKALVEECPDDDPDTDINLGALQFKAGDFPAALTTFTKAFNVGGFRPDIAYNLALTHYKLNNFPAAVQRINEIVERGVKDHPELGVGMLTEGLEFRSVGNTLTLHETGLVEAFNLKAAIEFSLKKEKAAREALTDMPPRSEEELDPVTLHNTALVHMDSRPSEGFAKLQFLLQQNPFPPETFANLLLLYCKYEYWDLAADVLAENAHLTYKFLSQAEYDYLDAVLTAQTSPQEAFRKLDSLAAGAGDRLRKLTKKVADSRQAHDDDAAKAAVQQYDQGLAQFLPVLMAQARIYWDLADYPAVERVFRKSVELCSEHDLWKLNVAHTLFMQESKFKEAAGFYEPIVKKHFESILDVSAIVLANLCVCYIMTSQNEEAEELMRKVEKEEEKLSYEEPSKKLFHLCIINLVIGTLYCSKGNYEFGISRVIKAMEPYPKKLGTDTWFYAKRCFLSLCENLAKQMVVVRDTVLGECVGFLEQCEVFGRGVRTALDGPLQEQLSDAGRSTVAYEARLLRALLLSIIHA